MAPHTCECKICGFQWKRNDQDFPEADVNIKYQMNLESLMKIDESEAKQNDPKGRANNASGHHIKTYSTKETDFDIINEVVRPISASDLIVGRRIRSISSKSDAGNTETVKLQDSRKDTVSNFSVATRSKRRKNKNEDAENLTVAVKSDERNTKCQNYGKQIENSKCSAVKEVTAMLDNSLVIPDGDIIAEREVIINFELDDTEKSKTECFSAVPDQVIKCTDEESKNKQQENAQEEKENINTKECKRSEYFLDVNKRVKYSDENSAEGPLPLKMPESASENRWCCSKCGILLSSIRDYNEHASTHVEVHERVDNKCYVCNKVMTRGRHLVKHLQTHEGVNPYRCDYGGCKKGFVSQQLLDAHRDHIHGGNVSAYKCPTCGKECKRNSELVTHMRVHTDERPYVCSVQGCGMRFKQLGTLKVHIRQHTGENPYQCDTCGKAFKQIGNYREHQAKHKPELRKTASCLCVVCGKAYRKMYQLNEHMRQHTGNSLQCKLCDRTFAMKATLKTHMLTHQENRVEYQCGQCDRRFLTKQACRQHQSLHGDSAFKCDQCDKRFINATVLKQHVDRIHKGAKKFVCCKCGKKLATAWSLSKHLKNHSRHDIRIQKRIQLIQSVKEKKAKSSARLVPQSELQMRRIITVKPIVQSVQSKISTLPVSQQGSPPRAERLDDDSTVVTIGQMDAVCQHKVGKILLSNQDSSQSQMVLCQEEVAGIAYEQIEPLLELAETAASMSYNVSHIDNNKLVLTYPATDNQVLPQDPSGTEMEMGETIVMEGIDVGTHLIGLTKGNIITSKNYDSMNTLKCAEPQMGSKVTGSGDISNVPSDDYVTASIQQNQTTPEFSMKTRTADIVSSGHVDNQLGHLTGEVTRTVPSGEATVVGNTGALQSGNIVYVLTKNS